MIGSRIGDLPPTPHELAIERGEVGESWALRLAAQADDENDQREQDRIDGEDE